MRPITALLLLSLPLATSPAVATKPTPSVNGTVSLSAASPAKGEVVSISLSFFVEMPLKHVRIRMWSRGQNSGLPCVALLPGPTSMTIPSANPGQAYTLSTAAKVTENQEPCDIFVAPTAEFGGTSSTLGVIFRNRLYEKQDGHATPP